MLMDRFSRRGIVPATGAARTIAPMSRTLGLVAFAVDDRRLALDLETVERVVPMVAVTPLPRAPEVVLGAIDVAGAVVPVFDIRRRLGLRERDYGPDACLVLARTEDRTVAVPVDEVHGVCEVEAATVVDAEALAGIEHVAGVVALDDGLLLIGDLDAFLTVEEEQLLRPALAEANAART
jgi:purine-binding chemotaxis protein CheW